MRLSWKSVLSALAALAGGAGLVWLLFFSPHLRFQKLQIEGNHRASTVALTWLAGLPVGEPLLLVDLDDAMASVGRHPWVASVTASRSLPDSIVLRVVEREAAAVLVLDQHYLVDAAGEPFTRAGPGDYDRPVFTGLSPELARKEPALARRIVQEGLARAEALGGHAGLEENDVSEVHFDSVAGYSLILRNGGQLQLGFRDPDRLDRLDQLTGAGVDLSRPHRIDLAPDRLAVVTPL